MVVPALSQPQLVVEVTVKVLTFCPLFRKSLPAAFFISVVATDCGKLSAPYCAPAVAALPTKMLMYAYRPNSMPPIKTASRTGTSNAASIRVWPDCDHKIARPLGLYFALPRAESLSPVLFAFITYSTRATFEMSFTPAGSPAAP